MKALPWIIAGVAFGAAAYFYANPLDPAPAASYGDPDVERAANKADVWGSKQRIKGAGGSLIGSAKQKLGEATGNYDLADEGAGDQLVGHVKDAAGKIATGVSDTLKDLNRS
jgi:uncharacterized protein YjbJ (UPF0337 family)